MLSLDSTFEELRRVLRNPASLDPAKSDPIFYFVHEPTDALAVKHKIPLWKASLRQAGREVVVLSLAELAWQAIGDSGRWDEWLTYEPEYDVSEVNKSVNDALAGPKGLISRIGDFLSEPWPGRVVFLTDVGLLHPYFRVRAFESHLHDKIKVPTVIFYPGHRAGQSLNFLGIHQPDGNYRSTLIGGQV